MDFLGNISLRLMGMVTTIVVLGAVYLFFVKPILDTTKSFSEPISRALDMSQQQLGQAVRHAKQQNHGAVHLSGTGQVGIKRAQKLLGCIQRANGDVNRMSACAQRISQ
jgi:hypothetical protein